jgi:hypothetical protein
MKPIRIEVPTTTVLTVKQAQVVPYLDLKPLDRDFDGDAGSPQVGAERYYGGWRRKNPEHKMSDLNHWATAMAHKGEVMEITFPFREWNVIRKNQGGLLANPNYKTALHFVAGKNFNSIAGHPVGTELFMIDDEIYRRLTWRSITMGYWDKKKQDYGISWREDDSLTFFLWKCEKINEEPMKSVIVDGIGAELLERDRPKIQIEESFGR